MVSSTADEEDGLPEGWSKERADEAGRERYQFQLDRADGATFLVWVIEHSADEPFQTRLTTISNAGNRIRHDYPIDTYQSKETALEEAESFVDRLDSHLREGVVSDDDPSVEDVQRFIDEFVGLSFGTRLRRFLGGVGQ